MVRSLTEIDYRDHMAWVALDPGQPGKPGIGVARYVRLAEAPNCAEAAVTVVDSWQGQGIGTLLLGLLIMTAVENGIDTFRAYVLKENDPMLGILKDLGATVAHEEGSLMRVEMPLPARPEDLPDTPTGRVLKAAARRLIPSLTLHRS
jgi:RimJ/RimL family protein N-acetyltransferase